MKRLTIMASLTLGLLASPLSAQQQNCGPRQAVIETLGDRYGESRQSIGIAPQDRVVEVFASLETGTWTIVVTLPNGMTCLVASGNSFELVDEDLQPAGIES